MPLVVNGWRLLYHPIFGARYTHLRAEVKRLRRTLPDDDFRVHPLVKLVAAVRRLILEIVPDDPNAAEFRLSGDLAAFRRAKGRGLPPRYRLFWVFSQQARTIIFLYLNDETTLRKEGARSDAYKVFHDLARQGRVGQDFEANLRAWLEGHHP